MGYNFILSVQYIEGRLYATSSIHLFTIPVFTSQETIKYDQLGKELRLYYY